MTLGLASEPLLHPQIDSLVAAAHKAGVMDIRLGTNGQALGPELVKRLLASGLTRLEISVDAAKASTYEAVRPKGSFEALERGIEAFLEERAKRGQELPLLRLSFLALPENQGELEAFLGRWSDKADLISLQRPIWFPDSALPEPKSPKSRESGGFCVQPWQRLAIDHEGRIWPCCSWYGEGLLRLDASRDPIAKAWLAPETEALRRAHLEGDLPGPCLDCGRHGAF
jgi:hypothetical protein